MSRLILSAFIFVFAAVQVASAAGIKPTGTQHVYKTVGERELHLYVTKPDDWQAGDSRGAIVFFHGGGWVSGVPAQFTEHSQYFASRGLVCFQVEYRLLDKKDQVAPITCTRDAKSAMRWIRSRSAEFGIDTDRIASAGGSAGGHLAAFIGCVDGGDDPADDQDVSAKSNAMLLFNPVYNNGPGEWGADRVKDRFQEFSPAHNLTADDPPSIVFFGSQDKLVPVATAEKFQKDSQAAGLKSDLHVYEGQGHGFFNKKKGNDKWYKKTVIASDKFLVDIGWLEGEPTLVESE